HPNEPPALIIGIKHVCPIGVRDRHKRVLKSWALAGEVAELCCTGGTSQLEQVLAGGIVEIVNSSGCLIGELDDAALRIVSECEAIADAVGQASQAAPAVLGRGAVAVAILEIIETTVGEKRCDRP